MAWMIGENDRAWLLLCGIAATCLQRCAGPAESYEATAGNGRRETRAVRSSKRDSLIKFAMQLRARFHTFYAAGTLDQISLASGRTLPAYIIGFGFNFSSQQRNKHRRSALPGAWLSSSGSSSDPNNWASLRQPRSNARYIGTMPAACPLERNEDARRRPIKQVDRLVPCHQC